MSGACHFFTFSPISTSRRVSIARFRPSGGRPMHQSFGQCIGYLCPRAGSLKPHRLTIRERGRIVFALEWQNGEQPRSSYKPGEWGRVMRRCLKGREG
jgi:hypothetical protein